MGLFDPIGGFLNDITGVASSAQKANKYAQQNAALNNAYQKEFAQNAHQWEMQDLKNANLNPALTAGGGSGASASGGGSFGGSTGVASGNPLDMVGSVIEMRNRTSATESINNLNDANALLAFAKAQQLPEELRYMGMQALAAQIAARASQNNAQTGTEIAKGGWSAKIFGTEGASQAKNVIGAGLMLMPGLGMLRGAKLGKNVTKFLNKFIERSEMAQMVKLAGKK